MGLSLGQKLVWENGILEKVGLGIRIYTPHPTSTHPLSVFFLVTLELHEGSQSETFEKLFYHGQPFYFDAHVHVEISICPVVGYIYFFKERKSFKA